jgi:hypothetical protein
MLPEIHDCKRDTVSEMMSALVVSSVLCVLLAAVARCDTNLKQVPSYRKESSTTFLRLTALRDDEGIWIARFGEYEVSFMFIILFKHIFWTLHFIYGYGQMDKFIL